jgi:DNA modification methylase
MKIITGNALEILFTLPDNSVDCCVTSPPYYALRDYGEAGQIGLERTPILAGCPRGGVVLDPFMGSGTTLAVAAQEGREGIGIELNPAYVALARERIGNAQLRIPTSESVHNAVE